MTRRAVDLAHCSLEMPEFFKGWVPRCTLTRGSILPARYVEVWCPGCRVIMHALAATYTVIHSNEMLARAHG